MVGSNRQSCKLLLLSHRWRSRSLLSSRVVHCRHWRLSSCHRSWLRNLDWSGSNWLVWLHRRWPLYGMSGRLLWFLNGLVNRHRLSLNLSRIEGSCHLVGVHVWNWSSADRHSWLHWRILWSLSASSEGDGARCLHRLRSESRLIEGRLRLLNLLLSSRHRGFLRSLRVGAHILLHLHAPLGTLIIPIIRMQAIIQIGLWKSRSHFNRRLFNNSLLHLGTYNWLNLGSLRLLDLGYWCLSLLLLLFQLRLNSLVLLHHLNSKLLSLKGRLRFSEALLEGNITVVKTVLEVQNPLI